MNALSQPAQVLVDPVTAVPRAVTERRWLIPLLALIATVIFANVSLAIRYDASGPVLAEMQASGKAQSVSEADLTEKVQTAERIKLISGVAVGLFGVPLMTLLLATLVKLLSWLLGQKARFLDLFAAVSVALLPIALFNLIIGLCALWQFELDPEHAKLLVPSHLGFLFKHASPKVARALSGLDFFGLWSAALLGLGIAAAAQMRRSRGLIFGFVLYAAYVAIVLVGLPGLGGGHP